MTTEKIMLLIIGGLVSGILVIISVMLMLGHLGYLLAGYNFKASGE